MINLLPPTIKEQRDYAKRNRKLVGAIWITIAIIVVVSLAFAGSWYLLGRNITSLDAQLTENTMNTKKYGSIESQAKALADRLSAVEKVQADRNNYIAFLSELAAKTPPDVYINTLSVDATGSAMSITAFAKSQQAAANFKNSLESSKRFSSAAIQNLDPDKDPYTGQPTYRMSLTVGLKEGALK